MPNPKPVVLCILDGWGHRVEPEGNAPLLANTPNFDRVMQENPSAFLTTHGPDVGLPSGQMGNSEVGHTNIGAGRVVAMDLGQIDLAIEDGSFFENTQILDFARTMAESRATAHVIGLCSDGGVHSHQNHLVAAVKALVDKGVDVMVHAITDGRDVAPKSAMEQIEQCDKALRKMDVNIVTVSGRYFAMDRDNRWDRVEKAYRAMVKGQGENASDWQTAISSAYDRGETDEFIAPTVLSGFPGIKDGDGIFFVNFRADRARELLSAIGDAHFDGFDTGNRPVLAKMLGMVEYSEAHSQYMSTAYPKQDIHNTLGQWVAANGLRQFRLAETEKYPHVTFFLNGGKETEEPGEDRYMAQSPKVATYDLQPEMSAGEVADQLVQAIHNQYDLIVVNFANPDMVGHTGDLGAAKKACEAVDQGLGRALDALSAANGAMIVTADHGNCEVMIDPETGGAHTAHTTNLVPVVVIGDAKNRKLKNGRLADLAPTILELMGIEQPPEMTGQSLLK